MLVFINGHIVRADDPLVYVDDRGLLLGDGVFETIKAMSGKLVFFKQHYDRLLNSAKFLDIPLPYTESQLENHCKDVIVANELENDTTVSIKIVLTRGRSPSGIDIPVKSIPTLFITGSAYHPSVNFYPKAFITNIRRNEFSEFTRHKTLQYVESIFARKIARERGFDEGIMVNTKGFITETSVANVFFVIDDKICTPRISDGILPGIVRENIIKACELAGIPILEMAIKPDDALRSSEAFLANSLIDIQMLSCINNQTLKFADEAKNINSVIQVFKRFINLQ